MIQLSSIIILSSSWCATAFALDGIQGGGVVGRQTARGIE